MNLTPVFSQTRAPQGTPGPDYWQNRADYTIKVALNDQDHTISGNAIILYTNNSPYPLDFLWLHLEQNAFKANSLASTSSKGEERFLISNTQGMRITEIRKISSKASLLKNSIRRDTRMKLPLKEPIPPNGGTITISIDYSFVIPEQGADRTGRGLIGTDYVYSIAQWYPRVAVFDDVKGWNTKPYLGKGEFYCEFGDFNYYITLPKDYIVTGSGSLQNGKEILKKKFWDHLQEVSVDQTTGTRHKFLTILIKRFTILVKAFKLPF